MLLIIAVVIAVQNRENVETKLLFVSVAMPRAALLFVTLAIGFMGGVLTAWSMTSRAKKEKKPTTP